MKSNCLLCCLLLSSLCCYGYEPQEPQGYESYAILEASSGFYPNFSDNPDLTLEMRQLMRPYLIPLTHPAKPSLDALFKSRIIDTEKELTDAGFTILFSQPRSLIRVAKHPNLPGYLLKIYLDSDTPRLGGEAGWRQLTTRCIIAEKIRNIIEYHKVENLVVPEKWIYPLPGAATAQKGQQPVILVVRDMNISNREETKVAWKTKATATTIKELFTVLLYGYGSASLANNIPYTQSGKFAFIDTEFKNGKTVSIVRPKKYFSPEMQTYWERLVQENSLMVMQKQ